jgi:hypothetical protein
LQTQAKPAPALFVTSAPSGLLQRKCACGGAAGLTDECDECSRKSLTLQRHARGPAAPDVPPIVHEVLSSAGQPLDAVTRAFMEARFGHDFSRVRVHTDARAAESARAVNAEAYTVGQHLVFAQGAYAPRVGAGRQLIAHELTHVLQQRSGQESLSAAGANSAAGAALKVAAAHEPAEREAEQMAQTVCSMSVAPSAVAGDTGAGLQRSMMRSVIAQHAVPSGAALQRQTGGKTAPAEAQPCPSLWHGIDLEKLREDSWKLIVNARQMLAGFIEEQPDAQKERKIVLSALSRNFDIRPEQEQAKKHIKTIYDYLGWMMNVADDLKVGNIKCAESKEVAQCDAGPALTQHPSSGSAVMMLCPDFINMDDLNRRETFIHEVAHMADPKVEDWVYTSQRAYSYLTTDVALVNADSYARFVLEVRSLEKGDPTIPFSFTKRPDKFEDCAAEWQDKLFKAVAEAELANFAGQRAVSEEKLLQTRAEHLSWFSVINWKDGACHLNDALAKRYHELFVKADKFFTQSLLIQCDKAADAKSGPVRIETRESGKKAKGDKDADKQVVMRFALNWDRALMRFPFFGWPNAILNAVYAHLEGVSLGEVPGAPKEFRTNNAASIAIWMLWDQRNPYAYGAPAPDFCNPQPPIRPAANITTANRPRPEVSVGAKGCPVPELQDKLKVLTKQDLKVTGVFDSETETALVKFQEGAKLLDGGAAKRGVADSPTWAALFSRLPGHHGVPTGEIFIPLKFREDDDATMLDWNQQLLPKEINFTGCEVEEVDPGGGVDSCCTGGMSCHTSITHGNWTVGENNTYGPDTVGIIRPLVQRYQGMPDRVPCGYAVPQVMVLKRPEGPIEYVRNVQVYVISKDTVACGKLNKQDQKWQATKVLSPRQLRK